MSLVFSLGLALQRLTAPVTTGGPVNTAPPAITGTVQVGRTLGASTGSWTGNPTGYAYVWWRDGEAIGGAVGASYTLVDADAGAVIRVTVTATGAGGSVVAATSAGTAAVPGAPVVAPVNTVPPAITGTAQVGQTLTTGTGTWSGNPTGYAYVWRRGGVAIGGATAGTYTLVPADVGTVISVRVTATNAGGSVAATSAGTTAVTPAPVVAPVNTVPPAITGTAQVGQTLTTGTGTWSGSPTGYAYVWRRDFTPIGGATAGTYALVEADLGATITVVVTATNASGSAAATSAATALVTAAAAVTLRQQIERLDLIVGRRSTNPLKVLEDEVNAGRPLPAGWVNGGSRRMNITQAADAIEDWDFRNWQPVIQAPVGAIRNCIFGQTFPHSFYYSRIDGGSVGLVEYCDVIGMIGLGRADQAFLDYTCDIQYCRFSQAEGDYLKFGGNSTPGGQRIYRNLFLPASNKPQTEPMLWNAATAYAVGDHVIDPSRNKREMISRIDNNLGNLVPGAPNETVSTFAWHVLDPHFDAVTVNRVNGKVVIEENHFNMTYLDDGIRRSSVANVIRVARDEGTNPDFNELVIRNNVVICDSDTLNPIDMGDNALGNFTGPTIVTGNWIKRGRDGSYGRNHNVVNVWDNNRDADTDEIIYPDGIATIPTWVTLPAITGDAAMGETLAAGIGSTANGPVLEARYQWIRVQADGSEAKIEGATSATYTVTEADQGLRVRVRVAVRNAGGWSADADSANSTVAAALPAVWQVQAGVESLVVTSMPHVTAPAITAGVGQITVTG